MSNNTMRIGVAVFLSFSIYVGTRFWLYYHMIRINSSKETPVAVITQVAEEVQKKSTDRIIWQPIASGDLVYSGEAVKTNAKSTARIQFIDSPRFVDLDADSLIVISATKSEIALDLLDGSALVAENKKSSVVEPTDEFAAAIVKAKQPKPKQLSLISAKGKVSFTGATASLSKSSTGVDLQDLTGTTNKIQAASEIKILAPSFNQPAIVNAALLEPVLFQWEPLDPEARFSLWVGSSRKSLKPVVENIKSNQTSVNYSLAMGKYFFKILGTNVKNQKSYESAISRLEVLGRQPALVLFPANKDKLKMHRKFKEEVMFRWQRPMVAARVDFELASDEAFKQIILKKENVSSMPPATTSDQEPNSQQLKDQLVIELASGSYYWRLKTKFTDLNQEMLSPVSHFSMLERVRPVVVTHLDVARTLLTQYYISNPSLKLAWTASDSSFVTKWKLHLALLETASQSTKPQLEERLPDATSQLLFETEALFHNVDLKKDGSYLVYVEGLDEFGDVLTVSDKQIFNLKVKPLLPAPIFMPKGSLPIIADLDGKLILKWDMNPLAKNYVVLVKKENGDLLLNQQTKGNEFVVPNLLPGNYRGEIWAIDAWDRKSEINQPRAIVVKDTSGLKGPKLGKVKIK